MPARVVYFNIDGGLDYENQLLAEWGVADKIELVGVTTLTTPKTLSSKLWQMQTESSWSTSRSPAP